MNRDNSLSVIIPVLDDADALSVLGQDLRRQREVDLDLVVVDGGSSDDPKSALPAGEARFASTSAGRALQMNRGAELADEALYLFLHADSRIRDSTALVGALERWRRADEKSDDRRTAGRFSLRFRGCDSSSLRYRFLEAKTALDRPWVFNGDQGLLIHRRFFEKLGGFDTSRPFLEDQDMGQKIDARGRWVVFDPKIETSARRFQKEGFWPRYATMVLMMGAFAADFDEFFEAVPDLYPPHSQTYSPPVGRFARLAGELLAEVSHARRREITIAVGRLIRTNAWQPFVLADLAAGLDGRALEFYDCWLGPKLEARGIESALGSLGLGAVTGFFAAADVLSTSLYLQHPF